jgi:SAM-dependent methyltransferase
MKTSTAPVAAVGAALWDAHASMYERVIERSTVLYGLDALVLGQLPSTAGAAPRFLDVACGTGAFAIAAAAKGFDVTATDFSPGMIARLDAKIASAGHENLQISTVVLDGQSLDGLEDASFDVVSMLFAHFPDRAAAWGSAWRVLKPGGRIFMTRWDPSSPNQRMGKYFLDNAADKPEVEGTGRSHHSPGDLTTPALAAAAFRQDVEQADFNDVRIYTVSHPMCFHSGHEYVSWISDHGGFQAMSAHKKEASLQRCMLDFVQLILDGVDPFGDEAKAMAIANVEKSAQSHPLWKQPFAIQALAHIAVATKPLET